MIITTTKTVTKEEKHEQIICDICKKDVNVSERNYRQTQFALGNQQPNSLITIKLELYGSDNYGSDGGYMNGEAIDICFSCAKEKVMPLISKTFNITPRKIEMDW